MTVLTTTTLQPFREYVVKVHSRCNLSCDYCYMYELSDRSARSDPARMRDETFDRTCERIAEHVSAHRIPAPRIVFHGGEPLLVGAEGLSAMAGRLRSALPPGATPRFTVQTNAVRLDEAGLDLLAAAGIRVGVSLDGDAVANDRHRNYANGRSSFGAVDRALNILRRRPESFAGILAVIDVDNDPVGTYEALLRYHPPAIDFLLPHAHWDAPPRHWTENSTSYGDWLLTIFQQWYDASAKTTSIRLFEEIIHLLLGGHSRIETIGLSPVATIVINTDGSYEQIDTLRATFEGAVDTGLHVSNNSLDEAMRHPDVTSRQRGPDGLPDDCRACPVRNVCGGGYLPHRYRNGTGFENRSVYCTDLEYLIRGVADRLRRDLTALGSPGNDPQ
jgi:uncharacterized protein